MSWPNLRSSLYRYLFPLPFYLSPCLSLSLSSSPSSVFALVCLLFLFSSSCSLVFVFVSHLAAYVLIQSHMYLVICLSLFAIIYLSSHCYQHTDSLKTLFRVYHLIHPFESHSPSLYQFLASFLSHMRCSMCEIIL